MSKKVYSETVRCQHCSNVAPMEIVANPGDYKQSFHHDEPYDEGTVYEILKCPACKNVTIRSYYWHSFMDEDDEPKYNHLYPVNKNIPDGLPEGILEEYQKAEKVKSIDAEFYALALRRTLEMVCKDKKAKGRNLADQIKDLATRGEIPNNLVKVAQELKNFGNIGAHAGMGKLTNKEIAIAEALCKAVLEYIYSAPYLAHLAETSLKAIKTPKKGK